MYLQPTDEFYFKIYQHLTFFNFVHYYTLLIKHHMHIYYCITRGEIAGRYRYLGVEYQLTLFLLANTCPNQKRCPRTYIPFGQDSEAHYAPIVSPPVAETSTADRRERGCGPGRLSPSRPLGRGSSP